MDNVKDLFGYDSLAFFGKVNASISHELKNVMAIISETAGLLGDLSEMARGGTPLDPDMLTSTTESIIEEIQRGFATIRQMNRFSHSVDTPVVSVDLMEILDLVRNLSSYLSFAGKINLHADEGVTPMAMTCPFILQAVIYQAVACSFQNTGPGTALDISVQFKNESTWGILFDGFCPKEFEVFPDDDINRMAASIGVSIQSDRAADRLEIGVPLAMA
jgi:light-regulated signal transduction histidine kinase (bacteriophytochrome)